MFANQQYGVAAIELRLIDESELLLFGNYAEV